MNYFDTKDLQNHIMEECDRVISTVCENISKEKFLKSWGFIKSAKEFTHIFDKVVVRYYGDSMVNDVEISTGEFNKDIDLFYSTIKILSAQIKITYKGRTYGVHMKMNKDLDDGKSFKFNCVYNILGVLQIASPQINTTGEYDIRYFPIVLSRNPYNIKFFTNEGEYLDTKEYLEKHDFDFNFDYNNWTEENFNMQRLSID